MIVLGAVAAVALPGSRRYTGLARCSAIRPMRRAGPRPSWPSGSRRWRAAKSPPSASRPSRSACPISLSRMPTGKPRTLADFRGRTVLLNLWATWCVPCRKEMPALDALQAQARRRQIRGRRGQHRHPQSRQAEGLARSEVGITRLGYYRRSEREGVSGPQGRRQGVRHADDAADRPAAAANLGVARRPRRMGERRRDQADRGRDREAPRSDHRQNAHHGVSGQCVLLPTTRSSRSLIGRGTLVPMSSRWGFSR